MPFFRKQPVVIEARPFYGTVESRNELSAWLAEYEVVAASSRLDASTFSLLIPTLEGVHRADPGDWIIKGVKNEFYPCKPDIFAATYEPAS